LKAEEELRQSLEEEFMGTDLELEEKLRNFQMDMDDKVSSFQQASAFQFMFCTFFTEVTFSLLREEENSCCKLKIILRVAFFTIF